MLRSKRLWSSDLQQRLDYLAITQFIFLHGGCLLVFWTGISWIALITCLSFYCLRIFAVSAGYHRYFAHRSYETGRVFQFLLALFGCLSHQKGPLWWAAHHRYHHAHSDREDDIHSPQQHGFWWAHCVWIFSMAYRRADKRLVSTFTRYRELQLLDRFYAVPPLLAAAAMFFIGFALQRTNPELHTSGPQMLAWGFFISTVLVHHAVYSANSIGHLFGSRRFASSDQSRNNIFVALLTFGDGWHNNHHFYPRSARHGFYWWEIDPTLYILKALSYLGIVWDLHTPPQKIFAEIHSSRALNEAVVPQPSGKLAS